MKLYILQEYLQTTDELNILQIFYKEPTIKDLFEALTSESYDNKSIEDIQDSLSYLGLNISLIQLQLLEEGSVITEEHIYYLQTIELENEYLIKYVKQLITFK